MRWFSTEIIIPLAKAHEERHIDVFHCDTCDKYTAYAVAKKPRADRATRIPHSSFALPQYKSRIDASLFSNEATIIAVILFSDDDLNRPLTQTTVVVSGLLRVANIHVVQLECLAGPHLFEWVFLIDPGFALTAFSHGFVR